MTVSAIGPHDVNRSHLDSLPPAAPQGKTDRQEPEIYSKDSIKQAKNSEDAWGYLFPEVAGLFMPQQHQSSVDPTTSRPKLESPSFDTKKVGNIEREVEHLLTKVDQGEDSATAKQDQPLDKNLAEIALLQTYIQLMKTQRGQNETNAELTFDTLQKHREANELIKKDYFNKLDEHIAKNKKSKILKWVNWIMYGALTVVGLASLALTITASVATGGAALPLALTVTMGLVNGVLSVGAGATSIYKGVLDYQNKKTLGKLEQIKWERLLNTRKIKSGMDEMRQSMDVISDNWKELVSVVNNWQQAAVNK